MGVRRSTIKKKSTERRQPSLSNYCFVAHFLFLGSKRPSSLQIGQEWDAPMSYKLERQIRCTSASNASDFDQEKLRGPCFLFFGFILHKLI